MALHQDLPPNARRYASTQMSAGENALWYALCTLTLGILPMVKVIRKRAMLEAQYSLLVAIAPYLQKAPAIPAPRRRPVTDTPVGAQEAALSAPARHRRDSGSA